MFISMKVLLLMWCFSQVYSAGYGHNLPQPQTETGFYDGPSELLASESEMLPSSEVEYVDGPLAPLYDNLIKRRLHKFCKLLRDAGIEEELLNQGSYSTVFVPTDSSFIFLPGGTVDTLKRNPQELKDFILYHFINGDLSYQNIVNEMMVDSVQGSPLRFNVYGQIVTVSGAQILEADLEYELGRMHIVDRPLYPIPTGDTVSYLRTYHPKFHQLLLDAKLTDYLSSGTFTILAPDDEAFNYLSQEFKNALSANASLSDRVLLNHLLPESLYTAGITDGMQKDTVGGEKITFTTKRGVVFANNVPIVSPDVPFTDGVIHVTNQVVLPEGVEFDCQCKPSTSAPGGPASVSQNTRQNQRLVPGAQSHQTTARPTSRPFGRQTPGLSKVFDNRNFIGSQTESPTILRLPTQSPPRNINQLGRPQSRAPAFSQSSITKSPLSTSVGQTIQEDLNTVIAPIAQVGGRQKAPDQTRTTSRRVIPRGQTSRVPTPPIRIQSQRQPPRIDNTKIQPQEIPIIDQEFSPATQPPGETSSWDNRQQTPPPIHRSQDTSVNSWQQPNQITKSTRIPVQPSRVTPPSFRRPSINRPGNFQAPSQISTNGPFESSRQTQPCRKLGDRITSLTRNLPICIDSSQGGCQSLPYDATDPRPLCQNTIDIREETQQDCRNFLERPKAGDRRPVCKTNGQTSSQRPAVPQRPSVQLGTPVQSGPTLKRGSPVTRGFAGQRISNVQQGSGVEQISPMQQGSPVQQINPVQQAPAVHQTNPMQQGSPVLQGPPLQQRTPVQRVSNEQSAQQRPPFQQGLSPQQGPVREQVFSMPQKTPAQQIYPFQQGSQGTQDPQNPSIQQISNVQQIPPVQPGTTFHQGSPANRGSPAQRGSTFQQRSPFQQGSPEQRGSPTQQGLLGQQGLSGQQENPVQQITSVQQGAVQQRPAGQQSSFTPQRPQIPQQNSMQQRPPLQQWGSHETKGQSGRIPGYNPQTTRRPSWQPTTQLPQEPFQPGRNPTRPSQPQRPGSFQTRPESGTQQPQLETDSYVLSPETNPTNFQPQNGRQSNSQLTGLRPTSLPRTVSRPYPTRPQAISRTISVPQLSPQRSASQQQGPYPTRPTPSSSGSPQAFQQNRPNTPSNSHISSNRQQLIPGRTPLIQIISNTSLPEQKTSSTQRAPAGTGTSTTPADDSRRTLYEIVENPALLIQGQPVKLNKILGLFNKAGLENILTGPGPTTVFLPSDDAFAALPRGVVEQLEENPELLRQILLYHITNVEILPSAQSESYTVPSLEGKQLVITMSRGGRLILISGAKAIAVTRANNGIFYVINQLLYPLPHQDIVGAIQSRPDLSILSWLLTNSGLTDLLQGQTAYTFMAPTDNAFGQLSSTAYEELLQNSTALREVLLNHIIEGAHYGREFFNGPTFPSARGGKLKFQVVSYGYQVNEVNIKTPEIVTGTGVVHLIDQVLLEEPDLKYFKQLENSVNGGEATPASQQSPNNGFQPTVRPPGQTGQRPGSNQPFNNSPRVPQGPVQATGLQPPLGVQRVTTRAPTRQISQVGQAPNQRQNNFAGPRSPTQFVTTSRPLNGPQQPPNERIPSFGQRQNTVPTESPAGSPSNVADLARSMGLNQFANWITNTGLLEKVHDGGVYTVFAPTDDAVNSLPSEMANSIDSNPEQTKSLLQYHIVPQRLNLNLLKNEETSSTLLRDKKIRFNVYPGPHLNCKQVVTASGTPVGEALATMGSVQLIPVTQVIYQPTGNLINIIEASPILQTLSQAIRQSRITWLLSGNGPLTFFAPSETAFQSLSPEERKRLTEDKQAFTEMLKRHLIKGTYFSSGVQEDLDKKSENNKPIKISLQEGVLTVNSVPVIYSDITATNGVLHVIDQFL